jgi:exonuclease VII small subunit
VGRDEYSIGSCRKNEHQSSDSDDRGSSSSCGGKVPTTMEKKSLEIRVKQLEEEIMKLETYSLRADECIDLLMRGSKSMQQFLWRMQSTRRLVQDIVEAPKFTEKASLELGDEIWKYYEEIRISRNDVQSMMETASERSSKILHLMGQRRQDDIHTCQDCMQISLQQEEHSQ